MIRILLLAAFVLALPFAAGADPAAYPGFGAESIALGGARTAEKGGTAALAYNPAGMNTGVQQTVIAWLWARPSLFIDTGQNAELEGYLAAGPRGESDPEFHLVRFRARINADQERRAEDAPLMRGVYAGVVVPLARERSEALTSLGIGVYVPQGRLAAIQLGSESAPFFVDFHDRNQAAVIRAAVGRDLPWGLSVGLGAVVDLIQADVDADVFVPLRFAVTDIILRDDPLVPDADIQPTVTAGVAPRVRPVAGLRWQAAETLAFGLAYRDESSGRVDVDGRMVLSSGLAQPAVVPWSASVNTQFQPRRISGGAQWTFLDRFRLQGDLAWEQWSRYRPPLAEFSASGLRNLARNVLAASGAVDAGLLGACLSVGGAGLCLPSEAELLARTPDGVDVRYRFSGARDILVPRAGFGWQATERLELLAGYFYRPSMESDDGFSLIKITTLRDLAGETITEEEAVDLNLLDNPQHGMSLGANYVLGAVTLTAAVEYVALVEKHVDKRDSEVLFEDRAAAPGNQITAFGYPAYTYGGNVLGGSLQLTLAY